MDKIQMIRENPELSELLYDICDVDIFPEMIDPQDELGHLTYSIPGKAFAKEGTGSQYILLEDGSVGFWGSEGEGGRLADSLDDFFEFMVNCPFWRDYVVSGPYEDAASLKTFAAEILAEHQEMIRDEMETDLGAAQAELAERLGLTLAAGGVEQVLMKFYRSASREPRLIATYREDDGSTHSDSGCLFED